MQVKIVHAGYAQAFGFVQIYTDFMQTAAGRVSAGQRKMAQALWQLIFTGLCHGRPDRLGTLASAWSGLGLGDEIYHLVPSGIF
jgi:hypothetical protein